MKIGKVLIHFSSLESTNDYASELLAKSEPIEGTVISADYQTAGKGQGLNIWQSQAEKNLLVSVILKPQNLKVIHSFSLNLMGALSVTALVKKFYPELDPLIKLPNDILVKGKKIGGILIRNQIQGSKIVSSVCGFGININQLKFSLPEDGYPASSLYLLSGKKLSLNQLLNSFLVELENNALLLELDPARLAEMAQQSLFGKNEPVMMRNKKTGKELYCYIQGLNIGGEIKIMDKDGNIRYLEMTDWKIQY